MNREQLEEAIKEYIEAASDNTDNRTVSINWVLCIEEVRLDKHADGGLAYRHSYRVSPAINPSASLGILHGIAARITRVFVDDQ